MWAYIKSKFIFINNLKDLGIHTYIHKYNGIILLMLTIMTIFMLYNNIKYIYQKDQMVITLLSVGYDGYLDRDYYCRAIKCSYMDVDNQIIDSVYYKPIGEYYNILNFIVSTNGVHYELNSKTGKYYVSVDELIIDTIIYSLLFYIILVVTIIFYTYYLVSDERIIYMTDVHVKESNLQHETLFNVATNINHEVNSPLLVIKSVGAELLMDLEDTDFTNKEEIDIYIQSTLEYIDLLTESSDQITESVALLSDYKSVRVSNGDKNLYMLVEIANKMLGRTKITGFSSIVIDDKLKNYSVPHDNGMSNSFFLSTIINHLLNSLEANAIDVIITLDSVKDGYINIHIEDNGDGIKEELQSNIYKINFSSKDVANSKVKRGVGLYMNKVLLNNKFGGDDFLVSSERSVSTIFCVKIKENMYKG